MSLLSSSLSPPFSMSSLLVVWHGNWCWQLHMFTPGIEISKTWALNDKTSWHKVEYLTFQSTISGDTLTDSAQWPRHCKQCSLWKHNQQCSLTRWPCCCWQSVSISLVCGPCFRQDGTQHTTCFSPSTTRSIVLLHTTTCTTTMML